MEDNFIDNLTDILAFLIYAEQDGAYYAGRSATDAIKAFTVLTGYAPETIDAIRETFLAEGESIVSLAP